MPKDIGADPYAVQNVLQPDATKTAPEDPTLLATAAPTSGTLTQTATATSKAELNTMLAGLAKGKKVWRELADIPRDRDQSEA